MRSFASIDIHWTVHAPVSTKKWCLKYPKSESALKYLSGSICVGSITVSVSRVSHQTTSTASFLVVSDAIQVSPCTPMQKKQRRLPIRSANQKDCTSCFLLLLIQQGGLRLTGWHDVRLEGNHAWQEIFRMCRM